MAQLGSSLAPAKTLALSDVRDRVRQDPTLTPRRRQEELSALKRAAAALGRDQEELPATSLLARRLAEVCPYRHGIQPRRWDNIRSLVRASVGRYAPARSPGADRAVSFLLSGPTGSGKSAWVRHLAERMGLQVVQKRASDILDAFVGSSERNIANAFAEARDANAFLVFDEVDSLLLARADAVRSWEVSQVNEMLTWMEQHALPFACTTNLPERLDRASLRRFVVKVRFDWLTSSQVRLAFRHFFGLTALPVLEGLRTLTPADFALVRRRAAVVDAADPGELARLLAAESEGRIGGRLAMGFAARAPGDGDGV
jgi:hypothetical protein